MGTSFAEGEGSEQRTFATQKEPVTPLRRLEGGGWTRPVEEARELERERQLVGSLTTTYKFKKGGLVKKASRVSSLDAFDRLALYADFTSLPCSRPSRYPSTV